MTVGKLFVDDVRNIPDENWTLVRSNIEAIRAIYKIGFNVISLDHDITHGLQTDSVERPFNRGFMNCNECFCPTLFYILEAYDRFTEKPKIILHSSNPVAVKEMKALCEDYGVKDVEIRMKGFES